LLGQFARQDPADQAAEGGGGHQQEPADIDALDDEAEADAEEEAADEAAGDAGGEAEPDDVGARDHGIEVGCDGVVGKRAFPRANG